MVVGKLELNADPRGAGTPWLVALWVRKLGAGSTDTEQRAQVAESCLALVLVLIRDLLGSSVLFPTAPGGGG